MSYDRHIQKLINDHSTGKGSTIKLLGETIGDYLHDLGIGKQFLKQNIKNTMKENNDKLDFIKIIHLCVSKPPSGERKCKPQIGEQCLQYIYLIKDLYLE